MPEDRPLGSDEADELFARLESEIAEDGREAFEATYGFPHDCTCEQDLFEGRIEEVPACYMAMTDEARSELKRLRGVLTVIGNAEDNLGAVLTLLAKEALLPEAGNG